jgi:PTH2 family peptidyl-tRNA hydrolase
MEDNTDSEIAMYIVLNNDLNMGKGKLVSQGAHAASKVTRVLEQMCYEQTKLNSACIRYKKWTRTGEAKIVLKATTEKLRELLKLPECEYIIDAGRTQIAPDSLTAIAFFPNTKKVMHDVVSDLKLL